MRRIFIIVVLILSFVSAKAQQVNQIANWKYTYSNPNFKVGDEVELIFTANIEKGWSLYSNDFKADIGPQPTTFWFAENGSFEYDGKITPVAPLKKLDKNWGFEVTYFKDKAEFRTRVRIVEHALDIFGGIKGQFCNDKKGVCIPFEQKFQF
ncbi:MULTISPECIES: protein-disulfide reductase DsbD domain-containing protein [Arcicella]|uniref:Protein-disulfide reductase DsbD domain-containing protein n=1 Tax=Arcicella lustrica TaxID=2984196 RepID=A0ABU5SH37_9BACT|nr:protein-disulfide reductase DsbD domain-containing protein [Arcicella sp. DC25W]MEA5426580.1 protein-disulfide reductase DsbD domain-containing protein [Arcicella sp. DC25W]